MLCRIAHTGPDRLARGKTLFVMLQFAVRNLRKEDTITVGHYGVGISKPVKPEHIPEHSLWVVRKATGQPRPASAWCRWAPELRIYYCGAFLRSEVVRDGRNVGDVAEEAKAA